MTSISRRAGIGSIAEGAQWHNMVAILDIVLWIMFCERLGLLILLECRETNLSLFLSSFPISFSLYSIETHRFSVAIFNIWLVSPSFKISWTTGDAASTETIEAACEEEEEPSSKGEPDTGADGSGTTLYSIDPCFRDKEEGDVEDESDHGNYSSEA